MMKYLGLLILILTWSYSAWSVTKIRLNTPTAPIFNYKSTAIQFFVDSPGDGTTEATAFDVFIPIENGSNQDKHTVFTAFNDLPLTSDNADELEFFVDLEDEVTTQDKVILLAIKDTTISYNVIASNVQTTLGTFPTNHIGGGTHTNLSVKINMNEFICNSTKGFDCTNLASGSSTELEKTFYLFLMDRVAAKPTTPIDPANATFNNGIFINFHLSNIVRTNTSVNLTINSIERGDASLFLDYSTTTIFEGLQELLIINNSVGGQAGQLFQDAIAAGSTIISEDNEFPAASSGAIRVNNLNNSETYNLTLAFLDKYNFVSTLSNEKTGTPERIEEFLKSQQCYLLSAGFQRKHFVIDYFKMIRDDYLKNFYLGKLFIQYYYESAPKYTKAIYTSSILSFFIRGIGFFLYFLIKFSLPLLFIIFSGILLRKRALRIKTSL